MAINFESYDNKKQLEKVEHVKKSKSLKRMFILSVIAFAIASLYVALPIFSVAVVLFLLFFTLLFFAVVVIITVVSLGTVWFSEGVRSLTSNTWQMIDKIFNSKGFSLDFLVVIKPYVLIICSVFVFASLIFSIVKYKQDKTQKGYFIKNLVFAILYLIVALIIIFIY